MNLQSHNWSLSIDLNGGRIHELSHKGIKIFGTYKRVDGKVGNTHICTPSFDKEGQEKYLLPFHGYARTLMWVGEQISDNTIQIKTVTTATKTYPAKLELIQRFTLDETFNHCVEVKNSDGLDVPVNIGVHYYWDTPKGWEGTTLSSKQVAPLIRTNGYIDLNNESMIIFPHAKYTMQTSGLHSVMLWTSFKTDEVESKTYSHDFCCIEPIIGWPGYFGAKESLLSEGEVRKVSISLSCAGERT